MIIMIMSMQVMLDFGNSPRNTNANKQRRCHSHSVVAVEADLGEDIGECDAEEDACPKAESCRAE